MLLMPCYFFTVKVNVRTIAGLFNNSQRCISGDRFNWLFEAFVLVSSFKACLCPVAMLWWSCRLGGTLV